MMSREATCWNIAVKVSRVVPYSRNDVYFIACRAYDIAEGDVETTRTITAVACKTATELNVAPSAIYLDSLCDQVQSDPRSHAELVHEVMRGIEHPGDCECLGCAWRRLGDAVRQLGREILKSFRRRS
jgi:hypothetical protein